MLALFVAFGVGALYEVFMLGRGLVCASGDGAGWYRDSDRLDWALRGRLGEKETRRRASESFGRDVGLCSESDPDEELEEWRGE
jgi:hypothetical protein